MKTELKKGWKLRIHKVEKDEDSNDDDQDVGLHVIKSCSRKVALGLHHSLKEFLQEWT